MDLNIHATADDLPSIFQGIGILPSQYGTMGRRKLPGEGERKLLFAVLEDAIRVYIKNRNRGEASLNDPDFIEAAEWNAPQLSSLRKTPFQKLGRARKFHALGKTVVIWA